MPKLRIKANELIDTDVNFVSLVKRGANRIPFRITKEDDEMLDLHKIGRRFFHKADPKPEIVAAVIAKGADLNKIAAIFKSVGLDPKQFVKNETGDCITVAKADADKAKGTVVLKVSDEVGLVITHVKKLFDDFSYGSTDFNVVMATEGVYPSICVAKDALATTIANILYKAASPEDASNQIGQAIDDFKGYMTMLLKNVPMQAFKMEFELAKSESKFPLGDEAPVEVAEEEVEKADAGKNGTGAGFEHGKGTGTDPRATADDLANTAVNAVPGESTTGNPDEGPAEARKEEVKGLPDPKGHEPGDPDGFAAPPTDSDEATRRATEDDRNNTTFGSVNGSSIPDGDSGLGRLGGVRKEGDADIGKKGKGKKLPDEESGAGAQKAAGQESDLGEVAKADNTDILDAIAQLQKSVEAAVAEVKKEVGTLSERVDQMDIRIQKTDEALNGTVFNEAGGDVARVAKSEPSLPPLLDTAYERREVA